MFVILEITKRKISIYFFILLFAFVVPVQEPMSSSFSQESEQEGVFLAQVQSATTCKDLATHLKEMIAWCGSQNRKWEKQHFSFLHLKCRRLERLELAGNR